jgi:hypothetical protein
VFGDFRIKEFTTAYLKRGEGAFLIDAHQAAVPDDVGR